MSDEFETQDLDAIFKYDRAMKSKNGTVFRIAKSQAEAQALAARLIIASSWFQLTPMPDDEWEFEVKSEHRTAL